MNIHEYQGKALFKEFGIPTLSGRVVFSKEDAENAADDIDFTKGVVVKAQIHAGGRGKAGGVVLARDKKTYLEAVDRILMHTLTTPQTKKEGQLVRALYLEDTCAGIAKEFYFSMILDRQHKQYTMIASEAGGMNIEEVAAEDPSKILYLGINPIVGLQAFHMRRIHKFLKIPHECVAEMNQVVEGVYKAFTTLDCELIEINPLVLTSDNHILALDAKMSFDENGLARQKRVSCLFDKNEVDPSELRAKAFDLSYIKLDGSIGCMVNGAGLAMATMDIIANHGGAPANFLDVGGGATQERVTEAFKIIVSDKDVKAIFVNIFGGIMRCDIIAEGIIEAAREVNLAVPLVVRLQGTNVDQGREILAKSGLKITSEDDFESAARQVVHVAGGH